MAADPITITDSVIKKSLTLRSSEYILSKYATMRKFLRITLQYKGTEGR